MAHKLNHQVIPYALDIEHIEDDSILNHTKVVIMCIDQKDTAFVERCIAKGVHYIDITANESFMQQVEHLEEKALVNEVAVALSIGLAPGITNLLVQHASNQLQNPTLAAIFVLLGIGEKHGDAAYRWTFDSIHSTYDIIQKEKTSTIKSFSDPKRTNLLGNRKFYTFNFSDQHTLSKTTSIAEVRTRMAFDSRALTTLIAVARRLGLTKILTNKTIQNGVISIFKKIHIGSDVFAVKAYIENAEKETYAYSLQGKDEGKITAYVAIEMALYLMQNEVKYGVKHIHQLVEDIPAFLENLKRYNSSIQIKAR